MKAMAQGFFEQFDALDGAFASRRPFRSAESEAQLLQTCIVAADRAQTGGLGVRSCGLRVLLHGQLPGQDQDNTSTGSRLRWKPDVWYISVFTPTTREGSCARGNPKNSCRNTGSYAREVCCRTDSGWPG